MKQKFIKKQKGITLVALVVTIVILLILVGITIMYTMGDNSIFKKAQEAKNKTEDAIKNEQEYMNSIDNMLNEHINGNTTKDETVADIVDKVQVNNKTVKDENGNKVVIPGGFKVVPDTNSNDVDYTYSGDKKPCVQDGIVIEDEDKNQFVWIPIGDIKNKDDTVTTITLGRYIFNTGSWDSTNQKYTGTGEETLVQSAQNYTKIVNLRPEGLSYDFQELVNSSNNISAKNLGDFVNKTNINGGYYLARYEISQGTDEKAKSQADKTAWVDIIQKDAAMIAREMYNNNYIESDLINSYSWDTAIVFIQKYSGNSNYAIRTAINTNKLNTGKSGDKVCNIHDMASNCREWSTEYSLRSENPCVYRGGRYSYASNYTSDRYSDTTIGKLDDFSFRSILYLK